MVTSPVFLFASGVITLLSLVAAITGPFPEWFKGETKVSNFSARPINELGATKFLLPLDAPLEEVPPGLAGYCTSDVLEWLKEHGTEIPPYQRVAIQNTAKDGAMLAVSNVRAVDVRKYDPKPSIYFDCPEGGNAENAILHLRLDRDRQAHLFDPVTETTGPFAFNLQPGEQGSIELHLLGDEDHSYAGRIVADVATGGKMQTVELPLNGRPHGFGRVSPGKYDQLMVQLSGRPGVFYCVRSQRDNTMDPSSEECHPNQIRAILADIGRAGG